MLAEPTVKANPMPYFVRMRDLGWWSRWDGRNNSDGGGGEVKRLSAVSTTNIMKESGAVLVQLWVASAREDSN